WGWRGRPENRTRPGAGTPDHTQIEDYAPKFNAQPIVSNSFTAFYFRGNKTKQGRSAGPTRPPETTWNQIGPSPVEKIDDSQVFSSALFANISYSYSNSGFSLNPQGGLGVNSYRDAARVYHGSYYQDVNYRPQHQLQGTITSFFNTGPLGHEINGGGADIHFQQKHTRTWPGDATYGFENPVNGHDPNFPMTANITRNVAEGQNLHTWGIFMGDTITMSNLTAKLGVRYDVVSGHNLPANVPANPGFPDLMPALTYAGGTTDFTSKTWQPRVGLSYALGDQKKTLLRASYSRYADQIGVSSVAANNPVGLPQPTASYQWNDLNHDHLIQRNELCLTCPAGFSNFDPTNPNAVNSPNKIDPSYHAPKTDEFIAGVDHSILPELVVGLSYTHRKRTDLSWQCPLALDNSAQCISSSDYAVFNTGAPLTDLNGNVIGSAGPLWYVPALTPGAPGYNAAIANSYTYGTFETNRKGYNTTYDGIELQATKRLSDKWMMNASFTYMNWKQHVTSIATGCIDPTNQAATGASYFEAGITPGLRGNSCANGDI